MREERVRHTQVSSGGGSLHIHDRWYKDVNDEKKLLADARICYTSLPKLPSPEMPLCLPLAYTMYEIFESDRVQYDWIIQTWMLWNPNSRAKQFKPVWYHRRWFGSLG